MVRLDDIFEIWYGANLEVVNCEVVEKGMPFVSRKSTNNGINCYVKEIEDITPNPANTLSIAVSGSVLSTYFHEYEYYSGRDVYIAKPKVPLTKIEMLFYCKILEANKYRYNYGRAANRTLRSILVPSPDEIPLEIKNLSIETNLEEKSFSPQKLSLTDREWVWFEYQDVFDIKKGFYNKKPEENINGEIPFIGATEYNNGITSFHDMETIEKSSKTGEGNNSELSEKIFEANCVTISNDGSIGYAFFQASQFTCSHSVNPIYLKNGKITTYIAMFLSTLIEKEQYRWTYGRKWRPTRMPFSKIKLPVTPNGEPDFQFMEDYIAKFL